MILPGCHGLSWRPVQIKSNSSSSSGTCVSSQDWAGAHDCQPHRSSFLPARPRVPAADCHPPPMSPPCRPSIPPQPPPMFPPQHKTAIQLRVARRVGLRKRVDGNLVKLYVAVIRPLAVTCVPSDPECSRALGAFFFFPFSVPIRPLAVAGVPSDPECSRPPGALSPISTFISGRCARDGNRRHPRHQNVSQSLSSTVNPFARGQPGCAMRTARVWGRGRDRNLVKLEAGVIHIVAASRVLSCGVYVCCSLGYNPAVERLRDCSREQPLMCVVPTALNMRT